MTASPPILPHARHILPYHRQVKIPAIVNSAKRRSRDPSVRAGGEKERWGKREGDDKHGLDWMTAT